MAAALKALAPGYTFEATVSINSNVATRAAGRWVNGSGEFVVDSQGASITYRSVPPRAWVFDSDAGWTELDSGSPLGNPLDSLLKTTNVAAVDGQAGTFDLRATYLAATLGLTGEPVTVDVSIGADGTVRASYRTATKAGMAVSETRMTPAAGLNPVVPPAS